MQNIITNSNKKLLNNKLSTTKRLTEFVQKFIKSKSKLFSKKVDTRRPSKWFWVWRANTWIRLKRARFMRRQRGNKRFSLYQRYTYHVHLRRFAKYDPQRSFLFIFSLKRPPMKIKELRISTVVLRKYLCFWYNINTIKHLKILYKRFINSYYLYFSFLHFLNYKLDSVLAVTKLAFNLPRAWDLIKLRIIFINNIAATSNNLVLQSGDFISLSWIFFYCFRVPRKMYLNFSWFRPLIRSFLLPNYRIFSFVFLGLPPKFLLGRAFNYSSLYKHSKAFPWFKVMYFSGFGYRGNFAFF